MSARSSERPRADLAVVIVSSPNEPHWLGPALSSVFAHAGRLALDVVVAQVQPGDGARELVEVGFPRARVVTCENRGFAYANNVAWRTCDARYALFLNPDTEILDGTLAELVGWMDQHLGVGLAGVRQVGADGSLLLTIRRFPSVLRAFGEALASERWPFHSSLLGERELRLDLYDRETACDWTTGSFMLVRREALLGAGLMDERFFLYREEVDLCLRIRRAGWEIRHLPLMTILHHADKGEPSERLEAQHALSRLLYAEKHFGRLGRAAHRVALGARYGARSVPLPGSSPANRAAAAAGLRITLGSRRVPFPAAAGPAPARRSSYSA